MAEGVKSLPEVLRELVVRYPKLPVKSGDVALDALDPKGGASICVQINQGQVVKSFIDGSRLWRQPFTVVYRAKSTRSDADKVAMIGFLNGLGDWLSSLGPADLPPATVGGIDQLELASVFELDNVAVGYSATYGIEYETT